MEPPSEPKAEDCCNSGCNPCIFDIYEHQLKLYKSGKEFSEEKGENGIFKLKYQTFVVVSTQPLCASQKILNFKRLDVNKRKVWWRPGDHFLYKYVSDSLSCTRAYTPIKLQTDKSKNLDFSIVVKCYDSGLVSKHLFSLKEEDLTLWRGPYGSYTIQPNTFNRIIMIAQGTGVVPFFTIIESILNNEEDMTKIILFYCCRSIDEVLFRDELHSYKSYWNFSYEVFLTNITDDMDIRYQEPINTQRLTCEDLYLHQPFLNDQFLICGSTEFMKFYKNTLHDKLDLIENIILF